MNQKVESDARSVIMKAILYNESNLKHILQDHIIGVPVITKILTNGCNSNEERLEVGKIVRLCLETVRTDNTSNYKRLWEELDAVQKLAKFDKDDIIQHNDFFPSKVYASPTRAHAQAAEEPLPPRYPHKKQENNVALPTPIQSPNHFYPSTYYPNQYYPPLYDQSQYYPPGYDPNLSFNSYQSSDRTDYQYHA